jgi:hypothetical protein
MVVMSWYRMMQHPNSLTHPPEPGWELKGGTWGGMLLNCPKWKLLRVPPPSSCSVGPGRIT